MTLVQAPFTTAESHIVVDEDWQSPLPAIVEDGVAVDITGFVIEIYVRPTYDHDTRIALLSTATGEIVIDDGPNGLASMSMTTANVVATFPVGEWDHFCRMHDGSNWIELFRGPFFVHAGETSA